MAAGAPLSIRRAHDDSAVSGSDPCQPDYSLRSYAVIIRYQDVHRNQSTDPKIKRAAPRGGSNLTREELALLAASSQREAGEAEADRQERARLGNRRARK